jgi:hypothetical protein
MDDYNRKNFLGYIKTPMTKEDMILLYRNNNIIMEKCELFSDFSISLLLTVFDTYMGDDVTILENQVKHFNWCWEKTVSKFIEEGLDFNSDILYDYFLQFSLEVFYTTPNKKEIQNLEEKIVKLWFDIFDYHKDKTNSDIDALIEIYIIFEKSLKLF